MDQFISTYQRDYTWPATRVKLKPNLLNEHGSCRCSSTKESRVVDQCGDQQDWSRVGPMGRLLDPKLYPAKTGPHPETEVTKHGQPDVYLKKLEEKYPNLYGILQSTPMDEIIMKVDQERLKSTYQVDYSEKAASPTTEEAEAVSPCAPSKEPEDVDCRPSTRSGREKLENKKEEKRKKSKKGKGEEDSQEMRIPPWRSEYQDSISRLGKAIIRSKLHERKRAPPPWV